MSNTVFLFALCAAFVFLIFACVMGIRSYRKNREKLQLARKDLLRMCMTTLNICTDINPTDKVYWDLGLAHVISQVGNIAVVSCGIDDIDAIRTMIRTTSLLNDLYARIRTKRFNGEQESIWLSHIESELKDYK